MNNSERPAHPTNGRMHGEMTGLTKREYFAMQFAGSLTYEYTHGEYSKSDVAEEAISLADELLKQLEPKSIINPDVSPINGKSA